LKNWYKCEGFVFWVKRITTCKSIEMSLFYVVHRVEPLLSFDLTHITHIVLDVLDITKTISINGALLEMCARQLEWQNENLAKVHKWVVKNQGNICGKIHQKKQK